MNLNHLRFAHAVAETASFTGAASMCCVTQPTLSNGIAQLEDELGERLFVRTTRKVALTPFGVHLLPYVAEVLRAQETLAGQAKVFLEPERRLIRVGTSPLIRANLLSLIVDAFRSKHVEVEVVLREMNMTDLYRMLDEGLLDFVIGVANTHKGSWRTARLYAEPLLYVPRGTKSTSGRRKESVTLGDISDETFVMVPDACGLARATRDLFRSHRKKLIEYSGEAMSYQVLQEWAALGIGAAILPRSKITSLEHDSYPIKVKAGKPAVIEFEAIWAKEAVKASHLSEFARHLQGVAPRIIDGLDPTGRQLSSPAF